MIKALTLLSALAVIRIGELTGGKMSADFTKAMSTSGSQLRMPSWAVEVGGPNSAGLGKSADGTMTLESGTYMLV